MNHAAVVASYVEQLTARMRRARERVLAEASGVELGGADDAAGRRALASRLRAIGRLLDMTEGPSDRAEGDRDDEASLQLAAGLDALNAHVLQCLWLFRRTLTEQGTGGSQLAGARARTDRASSSRRARSTKKRGAP